MLISYIYEEDLKGSSNWEYVKILDSLEDVCTLIHTYSDAISKINYKDITNVIIDDDGFYYMVIGRSDSFSLYQFINEHYDGDIVINAMNAKAIYNKEMSRGIYDNSPNFVRNERSLRYYKKVVKEENPTLFIPEDMGVSPNGTWYIIGSDNRRTPINKREFVVGRSLLTKVDFLVVGSDNVSRTHCLFTLDDKNTLRIKDLNSKNGTYINHQKVDPNATVVVHSGDVLLLADVQYRIICE